MMIAHWLEVPCSCLTFIEERKKEHGTSSFTIYLISLCRVCLRMEGLYFIFSKRSGCV